MIRINVSQSCINYELACIFVTINKNAYISKTALCYKLDNFIGKAEI